VLDVMLSVVLLLVGFLLVLTNRGFAQELIHHQNTMWGFRLGRRDVAISRVVIVLVGLTLAIRGAWGLIQAVVSS
jgi:hypothetical protein